MDAAKDPEPGESGRSVMLAAIDGTGGVGKSTLAIHAAHQLADRFPDGQLYVDLYGATAGQSALDPGEVLGRFLRALGVDGSSVPGDTDEASAQFRSLAAGRMAAGDPRQRRECGPGAAADPRWAGLRRAGHQPRDADHPGGRHPSASGCAPPGPGGGTAGAGRRRGAGAGRARGGGGDHPVVRRAAAGTADRRCPAGRPPRVAAAHPRGQADRRPRPAGRAAVRRSGRPYQLPGELRGVPARPALRRPGRGPRLPTAQRGARARCEPAGGRRAAGPARRPYRERAGAAGRRPAPGEPGLRPLPHARSAAAVRVGAGGAGGARGGALGGAGAGAVLLCGHRPAGGHPARPAPPLAPASRRGAAWSR